MSEHTTIKATLLLWLTAILVIPLFSTTKAQGANEFYLAPDLDGDGLLNEIEVNGWWNLAGGPYFTDPLDPDTDDDNLTDGEEKLFDSKATDSASPGLYVIYDETFRTKEYYPWQQYGHLLIARADATGNNFNPPNPDDIDVQQGLGTNLDAVVIRRGSTFTLGGPPNASLQVIKSSATLTTLFPVQDPYTGLWRITVPSNGTVGKYSLQLGTASLDLLVIFELPTLVGELTQLGLEKFVYDDNPTQTYDEKSVLLGEKRYPPRTGTPYDSQLVGNYAISEGLPYTFSNHQYNRYLLEDFVISAITGLTDQKAAANALTDRVDALTIFRNPRALYDSWQVLHPGSNPKQQCSNVSGLLTAFLRSVGIAARPIMTDWQADSFDHATEVWLNNDWRVYRGYNTFELKGGSSSYTPIGCAASIWPQCGSNKDFSRYDWGRLRYRPWHSGGNGNGNLIVLADANWNSTGLAYRWASWAVDRINLNPQRLNTQNAFYWAYWGWTQEPLNLGNPGWPPAPPPAATLTLAGSSSIQYLPLIMSNGTNALPPTVELGRVVAEYGVDTNGNGRNDQLILEVEVTAGTAGTYWLWGQLGASQPEPGLVYAGGIIAEAIVPLNLASGRQVVQVSFDGSDFALSGVDGPYLLQNLRLTDAANPGPTEFINQSLAYYQDVYKTNFYQATQFDDYGAVLSDQYRHATTDSNGNGQPDTLLVTTSIRVSQPGTYTVEGALYDRQDQPVSFTTWSGQGPEVTLRFENIADGTGPYTLRQVTLLNARSESIDDTPGLAYTIAAVPKLASAAPASFNTDPAEITLNGTVITPTNTFTESRANGNLQLGAEVQVALAGSYRLEAWLADAAGKLLTWTVGPTTPLSTGRQTLSLTFDGRAIRDRGVDGPYRVVALKILDANANYQVLDKVNVALTTRVYSRSEFTGTGLTFEDFVEQGNSQWLNQPGWEVSSNTFFSPTRAWLGTNADASLTLANPLNFSALTQPGLKFQTRYNLANSDDRGYLETSVNGVNWDIAATLTGDSSWSTRVIDLGNRAGQSQVWVRFRLASSVGAADDFWAVDDIVIGEMAEPAPTPTPTIAPTLTPTPTPVAPTDLRAYWSLNETGGQRLDSSGQGNHLADNNTVASTTGRVGRGADFEKSNQEYLSISDSTQNGLDLAGSFTLVGWFKAESLNNTFMVLASKYEYGSNDRAYRVDWRGNNKLGFVVSPDGTAINDYVLEATPALTVTTNTWYHLAAVFDAPQQTLSMYLNGNLLASRSVTYSTVFNTSAPFMLGANVQNGTPTQFFDGMLDEWRIYSRALTPGEIGSLMSSP